MATTIYATFPSEADAERAAGALMDHGVNAADISFIIPEAIQPAHTAYHGAYIPTGPDSSTPYNAPASYPATAPADIPVPDPAVPSAPAYPTFASHPSQIGQAPTEVQTAPGFRYDADGAVVADPIPMNPPPPSSAALRTPVPAPALDGPAVPFTPVAAVPPTTVASAPAQGSRLPTLAADTPIDVVEANHGPHIVDNTRAQAHAARGISTTTARDAEKGAIEGAGVGLGLGLLLGLATVAIPGVGLVAGAGALIAGLTAATGVAGAVAGGAYGWLNDMGLPPQYVQHLQNHLQSGGPILSIGITPAVPQTEIIRLLEKYGATSAQAF
jgi:hypothetical protein